MIGLYRRLLQQGSESVERERQLKESQRLYLNLRQVLSKQPGPEIQSELSKTQRALRSKGDKLKVRSFFITNIQFHNICIKKVDNYCIKLCLIENNYLSWIIVRIFSKSHKLSDQYLSQLLVMMTHEIDTFLIQP